MHPIRLDEAAHAVGGTVYPQGSAHSSRTFTAVGTDSRQPLHDALFVALRGERFDGHDFVAAAAAQGMVGALVDEAGHRALGDGAMVRIVVADTLRALGDLARFVRARLHRPVVAITGSNGKTTTKELCAKALSQRGDVHKTPGNLNNLVGLPLSIMSWPNDAWAAVLEMGMNAPGEIARLTQVAEPDVGLITCVAAAHLAGLGSLERVAQAKVELLAGLPEGAIAILNGDDGPLCAAAAPYLKDRPCCRFGMGPDADVRLLSAVHVPHNGSVGLGLSVQVDGQIHRATLPMVGQHNGMNAAAAVACAHALKLDIETALEGMATVQIPGARGRVVHNAKTDVHVLDDCYNANPHSMTAAIATLQDLGQGAMTVAVFGDMLELGATAPQHHQALGAQAAQAGIHKIFALGEFAQHTVAGAQGAGAWAQVLPDMQTAQSIVAQTLQRGAWCLVKGSRGMRLERLVDALIAPPFSSLP